MLTPGQAHDLACAEPLIDSADPEALIGDKAYDADPLINTLNRREITPVIPPKANRKTPRDCDFALYCERNLVERFFNKLKHFRAHRHPLRQTRQKFPRRGPNRLRYDPTQLNTGPSSHKQKKFSGLGEGCIYGRVPPGQPDLDRYGPGWRREPPGRADLNLS